MPINTQFLANYQEYKLLVEELGRDFQFKGIFSHNPADLEKLADEGHEVAKISHFDKTQTRVEGMFEYYLRYVNK